MARGVRRAVPGARCALLPIADGGDGLIAALREAEGGALVTSAVRGPRGERRRASYLWLADLRTAVIEMARASGLALLRPGRRDPLAATSRGTGDLMRDAVRRGARTVIVGMGGAASSDGGAGMARALGARLLDASGRELPDGASALPLLARVSDAACRRLLSGVRVIALCDVTNPLVGPNGSARVFGPQKGASPAQVKRIERALERWAIVLARDLGVRTASVPGAGAAGGLGAGLLAFARARLVPGADWVLDRLGADAALRRAELALTAEGRLDRTSLLGKAPLALARRARRAGVPCAAIAGQVESSARAGLRRAGLRRCVSFAEAGARGAADSMKRASHWAAEAARLATTAVVPGFALFSLFALGAPNAGATDIDYHTLDQLYLHRDQEGKLDALMERLAAASEDSRSKDSDPQVLWRRCRALVRRGEKKPRKADRLADYALARKDCALAASLAPAFPEAHFWFGVAMGRWGETKGMFKALSMVKPIKREMARTLELDPKHGGAHHVLGEILWQLPGFAGGDKKKALVEFEKAVELSPQYTANHISLGQAYLKLKRKDDAIRVLKAIAAVKEPADPAEYPENLADAKKILEKLEK